MSDSTTKLPLFDTHAHLDFADLERDLDGVLERARAAGLVRIVTIGAGRGLVGTRRAIEIAAGRDWIDATAGIHPHQASIADGATLAEIERLGALPGVVAIGEMGLDYHYDHSPRAVQREAFAAQIEIGKTLGKPIVVHTREAENDTIDILTAGRASDVGGIVHCFSGTEDLARRALDLGFVLSFSGIVTYASARSVQAVAGWAPADRILVETDAPYLTPRPSKRRPCEPALVEVTLRHIASLRGDDPEALARTTTANGERVYRLEPIN